MFDTNHRSDATLPIPPSHFVLDRRTTSHAPLWLEVWLESKKPLESGSVLNVLAERRGFEPRIPCGTPDFESGTFNHSATSPTP